MGHGSGSFGHIAAQRYGTRRGVRGTSGWRGFAEVATIAARLNRTVVDALQDAGIPVWSLQPSASAHCVGGELESMALEPVTRALQHGLVPVLYGDVALDESQGGTIISTEQIFAYLARHLEPARIILVGTVDGVFDSDPLRDPTARQIPQISAANWASVSALLGGSHGTDVTGGMLAKVAEMVNLARQSPGLEVQLISGEREGALRNVLQGSTDFRAGTVIRW
jgi:isopentenyl phosphate kinase